MNDKEEALFRLEAVKLSLNLIGINSAFPKAEPVTMKEFFKKTQEIFRYIKMGATATDPCK